MTRNHPEVIIISRTSTDNVAIIILFIFVCFNTTNTQNTNIPRVADVILQPVQELNIVALCSET